MKKTGFTLIELLIVIAIIGIMTTLTLVYFSTSSKTDQILRLSADEMVAALRETQNNALTGKGMGNVDERPCKYVFKNDNNYSYKIDFYYYISNSVNASCSSSSTSRTFIAYQLKNGVQISGSYSIGFDVPHGSGFGTTKTITLSKNSVNYFVCINESGNIYSSKTGC